MCRGEHLGGDKPEWLGDLEKALTRKNQGPQSHSGKIPGRGQEYSIREKGNIRGEVGQCHDNKGRKLTKRTEKSSHDDNSIGRTPEKNRKA